MMTFNDMKYSHKT